MVCALLKPGEQHLCNTSPILSDIPRSCWLTLQQLVGRAAWRAARGRSSSTRARRRPAAWRWATRCRSVCAPTCAAASPSRLRCGGSTPASWSLSCACQVGSYTLHQLHHPTPHNFWVPRRAGGRAAHASWAVAPCISSTQQHLVTGCQDALAVKLRMSHRHRPMCWQMTYPGWFMIPCRT